MVYAIIPIFALLVAPVEPAKLCVYGGELYAQTTVERELADSTWVGRVRLVAATDHAPDDVAGVEPWTLYRVEVLEIFKGAPVSFLSIFTWRNSGGFYMDRQQNHDVGAEYLLFLNPGLAADLPAKASGAMVVNYSCGRSGPWSDVPVRDRQTLERLSGS